MHTKCRSAVNLEPNVSVKFAIRFSKSPKIVLLHKNLAGLANFLPTGWLGAWDV